MAEPKELSSTLKKLSLNPQPLKSASKPKPISAPLADSWEDDELAASDNEFTPASKPPTTNPLSPTPSSSYPSAPPSTPISPTSFGRESFANPYGYSAALDSTTDGGISGARSRRDVRPDKTDAVAKRLIAGALGVKAPKKTEEQKAYDKALKEKEIKRRAQEKEAAAKASAEAEKAKAAIWDD